jgi:hypothetical protein
MMSILFPHLGEDVEFLLPPGRMWIWGIRWLLPLVPEATGTSSFGAASLSRSSRAPENAVAGPSRLG